MSIATPIASQRLPDKVDPGPVEEIKVAIWSGGMDQHRSRVDNLTEIQVSIIDDTLLGRSHGADGTPRRSQL